MMLKVAIALETWKVPIFKRHLDGANYQYRELPGVTADTKLLKVETASVSALQKVVEAAVKECRQ